MSFILKSSTREFLKSLSILCNFRFLILIFGSTQFPQFFESIISLHWRACSLNELLLLLIYFSLRLRTIKAFISLLLLHFFYLFFHCLYRFHHHILFLFKFSYLTFMIIHLIFQLHSLFFLYKLHYIHLFSYYLNLLL